LDEVIEELKEKMGKASKNLAFEEAAMFRDRIRELERQELEMLEG